ncbi:36612_t:CDS:2, partial [Racocetra persica]
MDSEVKNANGANESSFPTTLLFSVKDRVGILIECLTAIKTLNISLTRIESRPSKTPGWDYDFFIDFGADEEQLSNTIKSLEKVTKQVKVINTGATQVTPVVPWYPRRKTDLDTFADKILAMGEELDADHPGALDPVYRARRTEIAQIAKSHRHGQPIPRIEYTKQEIETWGVVFR